MSLPRCYFGETGQLDSVTLFGFCDASTRAYAAVIYMLSKTETRVLSRFVTAKTRVAPLQVQTVPRLELLSALLLSRLMVSVRNNLQREVPNIREPLSGTTNPADLPSRGLTMVELSVSHLWRTGPDWLSTEVPLSSDVEPSAMPEHCSQEQSSSSKLSHNLVTVEGPTIGALLECGNYSSWTRIVRVSAYVLRAVAQFKARKRSVSPGAMTVQEVTAAKLLWLLHAQGALAQHKDFDSLSKKGYLSSSYQIMGRPLRPLQDFLTFSLRITPSRSTLLSRAVNRFSMWNEHHVAGVEEPEVSVEHAQQDVCSTSPDEPVAVKRPVRATAMRANERMKALVQQLEIAD
eukprot:Em0017g677a